MNSVRRRRGGSGDWRTGCLSASDDCRQWLMSLFPPVPSQKSDGEGKGSFKSTLPSPCIPPSFWRIQPFFLFPPQSVSCCSLMRSSRPQRLQFNDEEEKKKRIKMSLPSLRFSPYLKKRISFLHLWNLPLLSRALLPSTSHKLREFSIFTAWKRRDSLLYSLSDSSFQ